MRKILFATMLAFALVASPTTLFAENVSATDTEAVVEETTESIATKECEAETTASAGRNVPHYTLSEDGGEWNGTYYYLPDGTMATDAFLCDGTYTYYLQKDGTPMKDRLT